MLKNDFISELVFFYLDREERKRERSQNADIWHVPLFRTANILKNHSYNHLYEKFRSNVVEIYITYPFQSKPSVEYTLHLIKILILK